MSEPEKPDFYSKIQPHQQSNVDDDDSILESMGYKQELNRGLGSFMNFAFGFTEVSVISGVSSVFDYGLSTGGPVMMTWGWIVTYGFTMAVAYSMAEICSAYPSAGSVYHWAGMVVPQRWNAICAYTCGWCNFLGNAAGDATFCSAWAQFFIASIAASGGPNMGVEAQVGLSIAILFLWTFLNFFNVSQVGFINNIAAFVQVASVFIIIVGLMSAARQLSTAEFVFFNYYDGTGWNSQPYVLAIGLLGPLYSFSGYEASAHMAEETQGSRTAAPYGIIFTCLATGAVGIGYLLALLFAARSVDEALDGPTDNAVVNVFINAGGDAVGAAFAWLIALNLFFAGISSVTVTGRITFALMRDGAFPYSDYWAKVNPTTKSPIRALMFVALMDVLLLLLPLVSDVAFTSIIGVSTIGFQVSYAIPIILKMVFQHDSFPHTPMSLGPYSNICGAVSSVWLIGTSILLFLPPTSPVTASSMNWTVVVVVGFALIGTVYWFVFAKDNFRGPSRRANDIDDMGLNSAAAASTMQASLLNE